MGAQSFVLCLGQVVEHRVPRIGLGGQGNGALPALGELQQGGLALGVVIQRHRCTSLALLVRACSVGVRCPDAGALSSVGLA